MKLNTKCISLNWCKHHGRSESLARRLNISDYYIHPEVRFLLIRYLLSTFLTIKLLINLRPSSVIVMQPPAVSLFLVYFLSKFMKFRVIGDLHTGVFLDPKWRWSKKAVSRILTHDNCAIVTNKYLYEELSSAGLQNIVILDDLIEIYPVASSISESLADKFLIQHNSYVLAPLSYAFDEPLEELLIAMRNSPSLTWLLTGDAPRSFIELAPINVVFTGYVSNSEYRSLLLSAQAVIALTTQESTMQRAGYEALNSGKPLLISNKIVLREFFGDAAMYMDNTNTSIHHQILELTGNTETYKLRMSGKRTQKIQSQEANLKTLMTYLEI